MHDVDLIVATSIFAILFIIFLVSTFLEFQKDAESKKS